MLLVWTFYTYSWFHLELQQVEGGFLVGAVHAEPGQSVLARGREDVGQEIIIIAETVAPELPQPHNFFLAVNPENVDGLVLHKHHGQGVLLKYNPCPCFEGQKEECHL